MNFYEAFIFELRCYLKFVADDNPVKAVLFIPVVALGFTIDIAFSVYMKIDDFLFMIKNYLLGIYDRMVGNPCNRWECYNEIYLELITLSQEELAAMLHQEKRL